MKKNKPLLSRLFDWFGSLGERPDRTRDAVTDTEPVSRDLSLHASHFVAKLPMAWTKEEEVRMLGTLAHLAYVRAIEHALKKKPTKGQHARVRLQAKKLYAKHKKAIK